ncbi:unnamed protein product, partial [Ectocarpus sp. 13 AM-2016]
DPAPLLSVACSKLHLCGTEPESGRERDGVGWSANTADVKLHGKGNGKGASLARAELDHGYLVRRLAAACSSLASLVERYLPLEQVERCEIGSCQIVVVGREIQGPPGFLP